MPNNSTLTSNQLGELIASEESKHGGYDACRIHGHPHICRNMSELTLGEIERLQKHEGWEAIGKYQMEPDILKQAPAYINEHDTGQKLDVNTKLTPDAQELIYRDYILAHKRAQIKNYITGDESVSPEAVEYAIARDWASAIYRDTSDPQHPVDKGVYDKPGHPPQSSISSADIDNALNAMRDHYREALKLTDGDSKKAWDMVTQPPPQQPHQTESPERHPHHHPGHSQAAPAQNPYANPYGQSTAPEFSSDASYGQGSKPESPRLSGAITPNSSTEEMFYALLDAAGKGDTQGMNQVARAYKESPQGQAWLESGRQALQQEEQTQKAQQEAQQQSGPVMRMTRD
jgi:hypothetical protein